jgi:hypothetical protein
MTRTQLIWLHAAMVLTTLTGVVFAVMKYFVTSDDPFAVVNHPLQPHMLSWHVVVAPLLLFLFGWAFSNHMLPKYRFGNGANRRTGIAAMALIVPMALSGYLLQVSTTESLRQAMAIAHWIASGLFVVAYAIHLVKPRAVADGR